MDILQYRKVVGGCGSGYLGRIHPLWTGRQRVIKMMLATMKLNLHRLILIPRLVNIGNLYVSTRHAGHIENILCSFLIAEGY